jgi:putative addiction module killer protein
MNFFVKSSVLAVWLRNFKDDSAEMRVHFEPGYRICFIRKGRTVQVLLCGGDKSTQKRDTQATKRMARPLKEYENDT